MRSVTGRYFSGTRHECGKLAALHELAHDVRGEVVEISAAHERAAREHLLHELGRRLDPAQAQARREDLRKGAERAQAMDSALRKHLSGIARWQKPAGGYFFWLELPEGADSSALEAAARAAGTGFLPGTFCSTSGGLRHCIRLSFAHYTVPEIHEGIGRLARAFIK